MSMIFKEREGCGLVTITTSHIPKYKYMYSIRRFSNKGGHTKPLIHNNSHNRYPRLGQDKDEV